MAARTWVVDAANVVGARPDGWWRDRPGAAARLHARILGLLAGGWPTGLRGPQGPPERVVLVREGAPRAGGGAPPRPAPPPPPPAAPAPPPGPPPPRRPPPPP
ncbi:hypothetical protein I6A84_34935, partial [Frankia sp. CNm7]|nr:hypothetical protein [Frankia nepalensis]